MKITINTVLVLFLNIVTILTIIISFSVLYKSSDSAIEDKTPTPTLKSVFEVKETTGTLEKSTVDPDIYFVSVKCPAYYGITAIDCDYKEKERSDIFLRGLNQNNPVISTMGAYCAFNAARPFTASVKATCDKSLFQIKIYDASVFFPGKYSEIESVFELWSQTTTSTAGPGTQKLSLSCPTGYIAENIRCDISEQRLAVNPKLIGRQTDTAGATGFCTFTGTKPMTGSIRVVCRK